MKDAVPSPVSLLRIFLPFVRPFVGRYLIAITLLAGTISLSLLPPFLFKLVIDEGVRQGQTGALNRLVGALIGVVVLMGGARWAMDYVHEKASVWMTYALRAHLFAIIQNHSLEFFAAHKVGDIMSRLRTDVAAIYGLLQSTFLGALGEAIQIVGIAGFMFYLNPILAFAALAVVPLLYAILTLSGRRIRRLSLDVRDKDALLLELFHDVLSNIHAVKLYSREDYMLGLHARASERVIDASLRRVRSRFLSIFLIGTLTGIAPIALIWYGGHQIIEGTLTFGTFVAFYLYTTRLYAPIQSLANRGVEIYSGLASAQRIAEFLQMPPIVMEPAHPLQLTAVNGAVTVRNVSFRYPGARLNALTAVSFHIAPGEQVAIVGPSGAGKTTLSTLLCRLYDVSAGSILLDGHDIRTLGLKSLRESIAVVSQELFLFNDSILENIRFGRPAATDAEVIDAARQARLDEFVAGLANGYHTSVGARGLKLSGGQRQRIALARAILKNAPIWILDEFTSSLDSQTETLVCQNLAPLLRGKTSITIAHRLSTVMAADRIIVLQDGRAVAAGAHRALFASSPLYRNLFGAQMRAGARPPDDVTEPYDDHVHTSSVG